MIVMSEEKGLKILQVWQKAIAFAMYIQQEVIPLLPVDEKWSLTSQLRRSAQSISANIAEGYGRYYYQEGVRYCYIARGSLEETFSHLCLAHKMGYLSQAIFTKINGDIVDLRRMLNGYIIFLKKSKRGENEPGSLSQIQDETSIYVPDDEFENPDA